MTSVLAGKVALVSVYRGSSRPGDADPAVAILRGLADQGASVGLVAPEASKDGVGASANMLDRGSYEAAVAAIVREIGTIDLFVLVVVDPGSLAPAAFATLGETEWAERCEAPLRAVRVGLQAAHGALKERGGRIVLLVPTIAINGAEGLVPYGAVGEGARSLAKAAARRWGAQGITVNCLALTPAQLHPEASATGRPTRVPQALDHTPDLRTEIAPFIACMVAAPGIVTGSTIMVDGGNLMSV